METDLLAAVSLAGFDPEDRLHLVQDTHNPLAETEIPKVC